MIRHDQITDQQVKKFIRLAEIRFAGNVKLKIFGTLNCKSGKRMKRQNRVFFKNESEAIAREFRACGHCMKEEFGLWKLKSIAQRTRMRHKGSQGE